MHESAPASEVLTKQTQPEHFETLHENGEALVCLMQGEECKAVAEITPGYTPEEEAQLASTTERALQAVDQFTEGRAGDIFNGLHIRIGDDTPAEGEQVNPDEKVILLNGRNMLAQEQQTDQASGENGISPAEYTVVHQMGHVLVGQTKNGSPDNPEGFAEGFAQMVYGMPVEGQLEETVQQSLADRLSTAESTAPEIVQETVSEPEVPAAETKKKSRLEELTDSFYGKLEGIQGEQTEPFATMQSAMEWGATESDIAKVLIDGGVTLDELDAMRVIKRDELQLKDNRDVVGSQMRLIDELRQELVAKRVDGWDADPLRRSFANQDAIDNIKPLPFPDEYEASRKEHEATLQETARLRAQSSSQEAAQEDVAQPEPSETKEQTVSPESSGLKAHTFAEAVHLKKGFSDQFIDGLLDDHIIGARGTETGIKNYLDQVSPTAEDLKFISSAEKMSDLNKQLRDMIAQHLKIASTGLDARGKKFLSDKKQEYLGRLQAGSEAARQFFYGVTKGSKELKSADISLGYITIPTTKGNVDIFSTEKKVPGVRPNIRVQEEISGRFVHWSSDKFAMAKARGEIKDSDVTKRIYLNPRDEDSVKLFTAIMTAANEAELTIHGKVLDRSREAVDETIGVAAGKAASVRADGIVLYAGDAEADRLLGIVEAIYKDNPDSFKGRPAAKIPITIGEGIAIGAEPVTKAGEVESLTSHRAGLIAEARDETRKQLGLGSSDKVPDQLKPQARAAFRDQFRRVAQKYGVNPDNFAFNA